MKPKPSPYIHQKDEMAVTTRKVVKAEEIEEGKEYIKNNITGKYEEVKMCNNCNHQEYFHAKGYGGVRKFCYFVLNFSYYTNYVKETKSMENFVRKYHCSCEKLE
jgi:hypothetical protein